MAPFTAFYTTLTSCLFINETLALRITACVFVETGTLFLFLSLFYTAKALSKPLNVQRSTWETMKGKTRVVWVQKRMRVGGGRTEGYIITKNVEKELLSAHRDYTNQTIESLTTFWMKVAVVLIPVGFVLQSVGLSMMHWPIQAWQFIGLVFMFLGRWAVRKQDPPEFTKRFRDEWAEWKIHQILMNHLPDSTDPEINGIVANAGREIEKGLRAEQTQDIITSNIMRHISTFTVEDCIVRNIRLKIRDVISKVLGDSDLSHGDIKEALLAKK